MKPTTMSPSISLARRRLLAASLSVLIGAAPVLAQSGGAGGSGSGGAAGSGSGGAGSGNYGSQPSGSSGTTSTTGTQASEDARRNSQRDTSGSGATATTGSSSTSDTAGGATTMTGRTQAGSSEKLGWGDRRFVTKAADSGMTELHMAQLAAQQASNSEVRNFAQRLVQDHTRVNQELMTMANQRNVKMDREDFKQDRSYRRLSQLSGMEFDQEFVEQMVEMHEDDVKRFEKAAKDADDEAVRSFASKHVDHLRQHLQQAQSLRQSIMPTGRDQQSSSSTGRSTTGGTSGSGSTNYGSGTSGSSNPSGTSSGAGSTGGSSGGSR